jgi:hypothetical protein
MPVSRSSRPIEVSSARRIPQIEHWWSPTISRRWVVEMAMTCGNARNWPILTHINFQTVWPDTAVRWVRPVTDISEVSAGEARDRSPQDHPVQQGPGPPGTLPVRARDSRRRPPRNTSSRFGAPTCLGAPSCDTSVRPGRSSRRVTRTQADNRSPVASAAQKDPQRSVTARETRCPRPDDVTTSRVAKVPQGPGQSAVPSLRAGTGPVTLSSA